MAAKKVAVIMGSDSDLLPVVKKALDKIKSIKSRRNKIS